MKFGLDVAQHQLSWEEILSRARMGEELGFDMLYLFDHFKPGYGDPKGPCFEGWTSLAALAAVTSGVRLGLLVGGITYRHPSLVAAEAVTVDHISRGRLYLGVGMAWHEEEHRELGFDFPSVRGRAERLDEGLEVMKLLMTRDDVSYAGKHYRLEHATYRPRPVQQPYPPIWIGGCGEKLTLPIAARHADVWHCSGPSLDDLRRKSALLDKLAGEAGRNPRSIAHASSISISEDWDKVRRRIEDLEAMGFSSVQVWWPTEGSDRIREFAETIMGDYAEVGPKADQPS
jgi:F420-dependent oxidoreductase-like protein